MTVVLLQSLVYSRVAAMVRACQFKIDANLQPDEIPFCGRSTANKICDIARTGTTEVLEAHRCTACCFGMVSHDRV